MRLHAVDWAVVLAYVGFAVWVGIRFARRAGKSVDEYFLSGRSLPWWIAGTSMVATSFASDTPLVISGWVREGGIWKNWVWWCFAVSGSLQVFLFARWWRRGGVMTKAELAELRYGGAGARNLRWLLGVLHAGVTNTLILCWVMLAAAKILGVLFGVEKLVALAAASAIALSYSLLAGFWGVVLTDLLQFAMAMVGALVLAVLSWSAVGGADGVLAAAADGRLSPSVLSFLPPAGAGGIASGSFWTAPVAAFAVYLGVFWWAAENVDGSGAAVQRISASRDERAGMLATLWFNVAHYALRPWPWIVVALASLIVLPSLELTAPTAGEVIAVSPDAIELEMGDGAGLMVVDLAAAETSRGWRPLPLVQVGDELAAGAPVARTDPERAYVAMMVRYLPVGLLGLVAASLLAAFMSTVDTHVNLASSFFVNDVYRRFVRRAAEPRHYVLVARVASVAVLLLAGLLASEADSIGGLFLFFLAFLGGVGPVYVLRWLWWRVRPSTEIAAMLASALATAGLSAWRPDWPPSPLTPDGALAPEGRLVLVVLVSLAAALAALVLAPRPDPSTLVRFYRAVRPIGAWGPVRALCPDLPHERQLAPELVGALGGLAATWGAMLGVGFLLLERHAAAASAAAIAAVGAVLVARALRALRLQGKAR
jgi:Na+/proline symporter